MSANRKEYKVTSAGRAYTGGEEFRGNLRRIFADLVYTASCLVSEGPGEMDVEVAEMRQFIQENQETIREALVAALPPGKKG